MSLSIDKDPGDNEDARAVLASWLDDYISGRCDRADMQASFLSVCRSNPDAPWDALALLDQYQRRGRIDVALARSLKSDIAQLVFGVPNHAASPQGESAQEVDNTDATIDTTGSRWRKLIAERSPDSINVEPAFVDPTLFRRDDDPMTRPPPPLKLNEPAPAPKAEAKAAPAAAAAPASAERASAPASPPPQPKSTPSSSSSDILRDRYELISVLGRGSTGTVYKALDRHRAHLSTNARYVAVKVLKANYRERPEDLAQLEREFHQAQSLSHPNIISVFDLDRDGDTYFIVMELLEGELLADILKRLDGQPMSRQYALGIISSVGAALAHAHRREIVHADLKPRNIMITTNGEVRVLDFGFARDRPLELHSASGVYEAPLSAPAYASVERVNGSDPHPSDDVYSLACIAYELLAGYHPFGGRSAALARAHGRTPQRVTGLSTKQAQALQRALLWTRGERKIDVVELLANLGCGEAPSHLGSPDDIAVPEANAPAWRRATLVALIALVLAGGAYALWQSGMPQRLVNAPPVSPPAADRELQSEAPASAAPRTTQATAPAAESVEKELPAAPAATNPPAPENAPSTLKPAGAPQATATPETAPAAPAATANAARGLVTIEFDKDTYVASEGDGAVKLIVRRTGSLRREVTFTWNLRGNSAEQGTDFAGIGPGTERIPAGVREVSITVPLVQDSVVESTELFLAELQVSGDNVALGERSSAAVIIVDDD